MKFFLLIVLLFSIIFINSKDCDDIEDITKASECHNKLSEDDKSDGLAKCCFVKFGKYTGCWSITQEQYKHIDETLKEIEKEEKVKPDKFDCFSLNLKLGFLKLLFLLL